MLILLRGPGQRFVIETPKGPVWLTVLSVSHGSVKLGIVGDKSIPITRPEKPLAHRQAKE